MSEENPRETEPCCFNCTHFKKDRDYRAGCCRRFPKNETKGYTELCGEFKFKERGRLKNA